MLTVQKATSNKAVMTIAVYSKYLMTSKAKYRLHIHVYLKSSLYRLALQKAVNTLESKQLEDYQVKKKSFIRREGGRFSYIYLLCD